MLTLPGSWKSALAECIASADFRKLSEKIASERASQMVFPPESDTFRALSLTDLADVKVVILGQDPYHGPGQAHGLSFSVPENMPAPPSLKNIFKEIETDLGVRMSGYPNLEKWARQGVLLLNAVLTVRSGEAASHSRIGWQEFTDAVIRYVSEECEGVVFMLWGNFARTKSELIDRSRHCVLEAAHPSPLARGAFFGCRHFSKANEYLASTGRRPIDWQL